MPRFCLLPSDDPYETLALEEAVLDSLPQDVTLLLYRHRPSVVIGRTQNAWAECRPERMQAEGVRLARRITGGGAVYHDPQNLNFSFIAPPRLYDVPKQLGVILEAVREAGVDASFSGRNDLLASGRKFSGNAFCVRRQGALHHGTLLIRTDTEKMMRCLCPPPDKLAAKGVSSVRSRVVNLSELAADLTPESMAGILQRAFAAKYGSCTDWEPDDGLRSRAAELAGRNESWEWLYGRTPPFDLSMHARFPWGGLRLHFRLKHGRVSQVAAYSDAMDPTLILALPDVLTGIRFTGADLSAALAPLAGDSRVADIRQFLRERNY